MFDVDRSNESAESGDELSSSTLFGVLRAPHRRDALRYLLERDDEVTLDELASATASRTGEPSEQRHARVEIDLHHVHLPRLADAGFLRYDPRSRVIEPLECPAAVEAVLEDLPGDDG